jgi:hypothetical protein
MKNIILSYHCIHFELLLGFPVLVPHRETERAYSPLNIRLAVDRNADIASHYANGTTSKSHYFHRKTSQYHCSLTILHHPVGIAPPLMCLLCS